MKLHEVRGPVTVAAVFGQQQRHMDYFSCVSGGIESLEGSPVFCSRFECGDNKLATLANGPKEVTYFDCDSNELTSLEGAPDVATYFSCNQNRLLTNLLDSGLNELDTFQCIECKLTSLKGGPKKVNKIYSCAANKLTSLEGVASYIGGCFECDDNNLTSLQGIHKQIKHIGGVGDFQYNPIKSHVLGLLKIEGLTFVKFLMSTGQIRNDLIRVQNIINDHLKHGRNIFDCQAELEDADLDEYAQL